VNLHLALVSADTACILVVSLNAINNLLYSNNHGNHSEMEKRRYIILNVTTLVLLTLALGFNISSELGILHP